MEGKKWWEDKECQYVNFFCYRFPQISLLCPNNSHLFFVLQAGDSPYRGAKQLCIETVGLHFVLGYIYVTPSEKIIKFCPVLCCWQYWLSVSPVVGFWVVWEIDGIFKLELRFVNKDVWLGSNGTCMQNALLKLVQLFSCFHDHSQIKPWDTSYQEQCSHFLENVSWHLCEDNISVFQWCGFKLVTGNEWSFLSETFHIELGQTDCNNQSQRQTRGDTLGGWLQSMMGLLKQKEENMNHSWQQHTGFLVYGKVSWSEGHKRRTVKLLQGNLQQEADSNC